MAGAPNFLRVIDAYEAGSDRARRSRLQQLDEQSRSLTGAALSGDQNALKELGSINPQAYMQTQQFTDAQKAKRLDELASGALAADTPEKWQAFVQQAAAQGHTLAPGETRESIINQAMGWKEKLNQQNVERSFNQQKTASDRSYELQKTGQANEQSYRNQSLDLQRQVLDRKVAGPTLLTPEQTQQYQKSGYIDPSGSVHLPSSNLDPESFKNVTTIRKEIQDLPSYKSYSAALPIYQTMVDASQRDSKAADLNMVYGLAKIYDPTSVVREGETVMVRDTASLPDWLVGTINGLNGGARLQPGTRIAMMQEAKSRIDAYKSAFDTNMGQYKGLASRYNINEQDIMPVMPELAQAPAQSGAGTTKSGIQFKVLH